ncbi:hypothetical protein HJFPF1_08740 [Paramyrothecium foliicola]|nr:hypothetical protein HJFPF1_08740 [Paramyrothecium foliicola]
MKGQQTAHAPGEKKASEVEVTMNEIWAEAAKAFESICGESLQRGDVKSFDDVQKKIEEASKISHALGSDEEDKWEKAKSVGFTSLRYLKLLVGAGIQASSFLPIPASAGNMASCALFLVFDIPAAIKGYNDAVEEVFGKVSSALSQFQIYASMEKVDPALIQKIQSVMVSFVKICAHVIKYRQGRRRDRFLQRFKSIFEDDSGLSDEMAAFTEALQQQRDVEGTLTLATVVETRHDVALILEQFSTFGKTTEETHQVVQETQKGVQALKDESDRIKTLIKIRETLGVEPTVRLDANTTQTCTNIFDRCSDRTGSWIWTHDAYTTWTAPTQDKGHSSHVLIVSGPRSSGKTSASALITKRLEEQRGRTYVAHYFFPASTKKSDDEKSPVVTALKYLAFQIARVDATVRKALGKACDAGPQAFRPSSSNVKLYKLWEELRIVTPGSGAMHYLIFDGLENLPYKEVETLRSFVFDPRLNIQSAGRVRILLSGTDDEFDKLSPSSGVNGSSDALRIRMEEHNEPDMRIIVEEALTKRGMLQHAKPGSDQEKARANIVEKLPRNVSGSYSRLQFGLDDVIRLLSTRTTVRELDLILEQSTSSHEAAIKSLQRSLTSEEISELNELLKWVLFANAPMTLSQLEAAMFLYSGTESLASLHYIIKNKYSAVLKIEDEFVYGQDGVKEYLQKVADASNKSSHQKNGSTISMTIQINNVDQEICGNFLWDLAHKAIRDKFKFDFDVAAPGSAHYSSSQSAISLSEFEAHHTIVNRMFEYLNKEPSEQSLPIGRHVVYWLPYHLMQLRQLEDEDKGALMPREQFEIGQNLYLLFKDQDVFRRHKASFEDTWWSVSEIEGIHKWLMDSAVVRKLDKKWRDEVQLSTRHTKGYLKEFVKLVVEGFLRERTWDVQNAFDWLEEFMGTDGKKPRPPPKVSEDETSEPSETSNEIDWDSVSDWCQEFLNLSDADLNSLWYERLAEAASALSSSAGSTHSLYQQAIDKGNHSWLCHRGLAKAHFAQGNTQDAISQVEKALRETGREGATPQADAKDFVELHLLLGEYTYQAGDVQTAAENYFLALNSDSKDEQQARRAQLGYFKAKVGSPDASTTLEYLKASLAEESDKDIMAKVFKMVAGDDEHDTLVWKIFTVARGDMELLKTIVHVMQAAAPGDVLDEINFEAMAESDRFAEEEARGVLLFDRGLAAYIYKISPDGTEAIGEALRLWNKSRDILSHVGGHNAFAATRKATSMLAQHYFQSMVDGKHLDHIDALTKLVGNNTDLFSGTTGHLGTLYALRGEKEQAMATTAWRMKLGLQILSDDTPENDELGYFAIQQTLEQCQDFRRTAVAISMVGQPDLTTQALTFNAEDITVPKDLDKEQVLELVTKLATETIRTVKKQFPSSSQQKERIAAAKTYVDSVSDAWKIVPAKEGGGEKSGTRETQAEEGGLDSVETETSVAYRCVSSSISELLSVYGPETDFKTVARGRWMCDGRTLDGKECTNGTNFEREMYHCVYCSVQDFCAECLGRLRDPASDPIFTFCSPKHRWMRVPPQGADMFVGARSKTVRVPKEVKGQENDESILEIHYGEDDGKDQITLESWKEDLAKEWDISLDEIKKEASGKQNPGEGEE